MYSVNEYLLKINRFLIKVVKSQQMSMTQNASEYTDCY